jgi:hypothetical protein
MPAKNENAGFESEKPKLAIRNLVVYLLYIGAVVGIGARLGAFQKPSLPPPPKVLPITRALATAPPPNVPAPINQLPQGILAFDREFKQASVHNGDAQAHFVFNLTNVSKQAVVIDAVNTSCGCTAAQLPQSPWTLKPRDHGQIQVAVNVSPYIEKTTKSVTLLTPLGVKSLSVEVAVLSETNLTAPGLR